MKFPNAWAANLTSPAFGKKKLLQTDAGEDPRNPYRHKVRLFRPTA